ncbi:septum formation protein Maf [Candidatus Woesearchaeota archaeon]|nr:septum formation protein Maf [Candidatus Woesearchaeota archaeon]
MDILLASSSPRRIALMRQFRIPCKVAAGTFQENNSLNMSPVKLVLYNAVQKARSAKRRASKDALIIGADTVVVSGGTVLGKPVTAKRALKMLKAIRGKTVKVISGVAVYNTKTGKLYKAYDTAWVKMKHYSGAQINRYIATGEPLDRAGAFAVQEKGAALVASIKGDLNTVIGMPMKKLLMLLKKAGA